MNKLILSTAIAVFASSAALAEDYQFEVGASYKTGDNGGPDVDTLGAYGTIHFDTVDTSKGPLAEAAFLDKSSSVTAAIDSTEIDVPGADDSNDVKLSTRVVFENEFILEASYTDFDAADDSALNIGVGVYLNDDTDIVLSYTDFDEADNSTLKLDMHSVKSLGDDTFFAYDLGVSYLDVGEDDGFGIDAGVDYYFTREFSLGASVAHASLDNFDSTEVSIDASYFVAPSIELSAIYSTFSQDADGDFFSIAAAVRF